MEVNITYKNKTTRIEKAIIEIDGKSFIFTGEKAREIAKMSNTDKPDIKNFIESLIIQQ